MQRNAVGDLFWKIHPKLYRFSGGRLLGRLVGMEVLILNTRGRRSGQERSTCLTTFREGGAFVVIGSFLGEPRDPGWVHNLRAQAEGVVKEFNGLASRLGHEKALKLSEVAGSPKGEANG